LGWRDARLPQSTHRRLSRPVIGAAPSGSRPRVDISGITHLSFDCYGTLIDWETGILEQAIPRLARAGARNLHAAAGLRAFAKHGAVLERGRFRPYRQVLLETFCLIGRDLGAQVDQASAADFAAALTQWPPFPDTVAALSRLAAKYRLLILSNVDDDLFEETAGRLATSFEAVITAQQVKSYKPALGHFEAARERLGLTPAPRGPVAPSLYHDQPPPKPLHLRTLWP